MQGRPSGQGEEEEEGHLESEPIHQAPSQRAKRQLPQHLQRGQETVVGCLRVERKAGLKPKKKKKKKKEERRKTEREMKVTGEKRKEGGEGKIKGHCVLECENHGRGEVDKTTTSSSCACTARISTTILADHKNGI